MKPSMIVFGISALILAIVDLIHGQHNGDAHRIYIHVAEFVALLAFLSLLEIQTFMLMRRKFGLNRWLACFYVSAASFLIGFALFGLAGGSAHGDGGPVAVSFAIAGCLGAIGSLISIVGFVVVLVLRRLRAPSSLKA